MSGGGYGFYLALRKEGFPNIPPLRVECYNCNCGGNQLADCVDHEMPAWCSICLGKLVESEDEKWDVESPLRGPEKNPLAFRRQRCHGKYVGVYTQHDTEYWMFQISRKREKKKIIRGFGYKTPEEARDARAATLAQLQGGKL